MPLIIALIISALLLTVPATAADYKKGLAAYRARDYATARAEWQPLAEAGDTSAMNNLALMYKKGLGVPKDMTKAFLYFEKAAERGLSLAAFNLAGMYQTGKGTRKSPLKAANWLRKAADRNMARAQFVIGKWYARGFGLRKSKIRALTWYMIAFKNSKGKLNKEIRTRISALQSSLKLMEVNEAMRDVAVYKPK